MGQERLRQQHAKELEEKELDMETIKASTQKKVCFSVGSMILTLAYLLHSAVWEDVTQKSRNTGLYVAYKNPSPIQPILCLRGTIFLPDWARRSQPTRLTVPTSTYHLVACLVGTGSVVLVDQTTDGSIRFVTTTQHALDVMEISHSLWPWHRSDATALAGYANMMMIMMAC